MPDAVAARRAALALTAALFWHISLRARPATLPLITDEGEYAAAARVWSEGALPYRDAFTQKPPTAIALYRLAGALSSSPHAARGLSGLFALGTMLVLFLAVPAAWGLAARVAASAAFAGLSLIPIGDYGFPANTEGFLNFFAALSALALLRGGARAALWAGLWAGAALSTKQTFFWTTAGFGALAALFDARGPWRGARDFAAGAAVFPAAWALYFLARGAFPDFWRGAVAGNARYASVLVMTGALSAQVRWFATTLLPGLLAHAAAAFALGGYALSGLRAGRETPVETLAVVWFATAVAGALTGLFLFPHYFLQTAPGLCLAAACGVRRLEASRGARAAAAAAVFLAAWPVLLSPRLFLAAGPRELAVRLLHPNPLDECRVLGAEIARRAALGDRLHVFGSEGALFSYSGLRPATKHTLSYALTLFPDGLEPIEAELAALRAKPPRFIVWSGQPLSTMISSNLGHAYRDGILAILDDGYEYSGKVVVEGGPAYPKFQAARPRELPPLDAEDSLFLFTRKLR